MTEDIVPGLLAKIDTEFQQRIMESKTLNQLMARLTNEKATYLDAGRFAVRVGEILSDILLREITLEVMPDQKLYYNIANRIMNHVLTNNHQLISEYATKVQDLLNKKAGIGIAPRSLSVNQDKINGFVAALSDTTSSDTLNTIFGEKIITYSQSIVADTISENAKFHLKSGFRPLIIRTIHGHAPCDFCQKLAGTWIYADVDHAVFKRHDRCRCTVDYKPDKHTRQNVYTKAKRMEGASNAIEQIKVNNFKLDKDEYNKLLRELGPESVNFSLSQFQTMKYNDSERYTWLKRDERFYSELNSKDWNKQFKEKSRQSYEFFKENGISVSTHAVSRLPRLNKNNYRVITNDDIVELMQEQPKFIDGDQKAIYFDETKQLALIQNIQTKDIVSIVRRKNQKEDWKNV